MKRDLTFIDLFAGCGGFSLGLVAAGFTSTVKVEVDAWACETLRENFPDSFVFQGDIKSIPDIAVEQLKGVDVIVGGPPCQGFSVAGPSQFGFTDPRNELVQYFLNWIKLAEPKFAVMENVPTILTKKSSDGVTILDVIEAELAPFGYEVKVLILNAASFGVPQFRKRAFIVAAKHPYKLESPIPTCGESEPASLFTTQDRLFPYVTAWEALSDLPELAAGEGTDQISEYRKDPENAYQELMRVNSKGVVNHVAMRHTNRLIERFAQILPGQSLKDAPLQNGQIQKHTGEINDKPFKYNNFRIVADSPCLTIPASFQSLFLHPVANRNLTAREAARLMGFPDRFVFCGKRTTMGWERHLSQYNQIGNAVCPPVARAIGLAIADALNNDRFGEFRQVDYVRSVKRFAVEVESVSQEHESRVMTPLIPNLPESTSLHRLLADADMELIKSFSLPDLQIVSGQLVWNGTHIPLGAMWLTLLFARDATCSVCRSDLPPFGEHHGTLQLLISKEDLNSLVRKERDHGLDYHIRAFFSFDAHVAHAIGELLEAMSLVKLSLQPNPRTGKPGRSLEVLTGIQPNAALAETYAKWKNRIMEAPSILTAETTTVDRPKKNGGLATSLASKK